MRISKRDLLKNRTLLLFLAAILLLVSSIVFGWIAGQLALKNEKQLSHEQYEIDLIDRHLATLMDAEAGQRGYLITGREDYLAPYNEALLRIGKEFDELKAAGEEGDLKEEEMKRLSELTNRKLAELSETIKLRRAGGLEAALPMVQSGEGKESMEELRSLVSKMKQKEESEQNRILSQGVRISLLRSMVFVLGTIVNVAFLLWAYKKIDEEKRERQRAQEALRRQAALIELRPSGPGGTLLRWVMPIIFVCLAASTRYLLEPWVGPNIPFGLFFLAIAAAALYSGFSPAVLASVIAALVSDYLFIGPPYQFLSGSSYELHTISLFFATCLAISALGYQAQRARGKLEAAVDVLGRQAALIDLSPDAIIVRLADGTIKSWSRGAEILYGWRKDEAIGKNTDELLGTSFPEPAETIIQKMKRGREWRGELVHNAKGGRKVIVESRWRPEKVKGELEILESNVDLTERKASEERFILLADNMSQLAWMADETGVIYWYNKRWLDYTGTSLEEMRDFGWQKVHHPDHVKRVVEKLSRCFETGETWEDTFPLKGRDENYRWFLSRAIPVKDPGGAVVRWFGTNTDITEQKQAEDALRIAEEQARNRYAELEQIYRYAPVGLFSLDREYRYTKINELLASFNGFPVEQHIGRSLFEVVPQLAPLLRSLLAPVLEKGQPLLGTEIHGETAARPGGRRAWLGSFFPLRSGSGEVVGLMGAVQDVTDMKRAEKERSELEAQAQRAQRLESIGILAGGIAHDFNNLLSGIFGYVEAARLYAGSGSPNKTVTALDNVLTAFSRAKGLTAQLLTFSKGGAPIVKLEDVSKLLREAATFVLSGSRVDARLDLPEGLWTCKVDINQLRQAIDNILINARDVTQDGGVISVSAANISSNEPLPKTLLQGNYVRISVSDTGPGIPPEVRERIFDPFFSTKEAGHGLGLSIAYSVVKKHGGTIEVESTVNKGATFHVYLPASREPVKEEAAKEALQQRPLTRGKVLIMDDEKMVREVTTMMLEGLGYLVTEAADGEEAIRLYKEAIKGETPFNILILDLTVKNGLGGKETLERLIKEYPGVQAIVASGYSTDPVMSSPGAYGFRFALNKPFQSQELEEALSKIQSGPVQKN